MNIAPSYPNLVPLAQQPATEAARRDNVQRERIPQPAESASGKTDNRFDNSADTPQRYISNTQSSASDTYSVASVKNNSAKNSTETTLPTSETVTAASEQSRRNGQTSSQGDDASSEEEKKKAQQEEKVVQDLKKRDAEVRTHEQAHKTAGGQYAGSPAFEMTKGPDGQSYATGGHVNIDVSAIPDDPQATLNKMMQIKSAALAPAEPSAQDLKVAAKADMVAAAARSELSQSATPATDSSETTKTAANTTQNSATRDEPFVSQQMRQRGVIILARYQSSGRPQAQTALTAYS
jgi:hypothetical protein